MVSHVVQVTGSVAMIWMMMMIRYAKHNSPVYRSALGCVLKCTESGGGKKQLGRIKGITRVDGGSEFVCSAATLYSASS